MFLLLACVEGGLVVQGWGEQDTAVPESEPLDTGEPCTPITWWADADGDGFGGSDISVSSCEAIDGMVEDSTDCDDLDPDIFPGAPELCDGVDQDCDDVVDEDALDRVEYHQDADGDGYGDPDASELACDQPSGFVLSDNDCDDTSAEVHPGADEIPGDGVDQSCDGTDPCADLDCDGETDLVFPEYVGSTSPVFSPSGGRYSAATTSLSSQASLGAASSDLDQDGYVDVVFASVDDGGEAVVHWGSASGPSESTALGASGASQVAIADLDGDGWDDVVFGVWYVDGYETESLIWMGSEDGFAEPIEVETHSVASLDVGDLNGDGDLDVVFCSTYGSTAAWYGPDFTASTTVPAPTCAQVVVHDLNGDGYDDAVLARDEDDSRIHWGTPSGISSVYVDELETSNARGVAVSDVDADGYDDVVFGGFSGYTYVYWNSSLGFSELDRSLLTTAGCMRVAAADLDGDGYAEVVCPTLISGGDYEAPSQVFWGGPDGPSDEDVTLLDAEGAVHVAIGDLDGDGLPELVFGGYFSGDWNISAKSYVYWGTRSGYSFADVDVLPTGSSWGPALLVGRTDW